MLPRVSRWTAARSARKLDHKTLEVLRIRAVERVGEGAHPEDVAAALGLHRKTVYDWLAKYREGGKDALRARPVPGRPREVIRREFGIGLSVVSVGRLLRKLGLSAQRPLHRAYQQDPEAVERWKKETYPGIRKEAEAAGAVIYFADEAGIRSDYHAGTTWAPAGQTTVVANTGSRFLVHRDAGAFQDQIDQGRADDQVPAGHCLEHRAQGPAGSDRAPPTTDRQTPEHGSQSREHHLRHPCGFLLQGAGQCRAVGRVDRCTPWAGAPDGAGRRHGDGR